jgi:ATP-dependent DNA helicase RecQ
MIGRAREILQRIYGYDDFRSHQAVAIEHVLAGGDCLVLMPTGGGKSLCYQVPGLLRDGTAVVVSPLIALMEDQVHALTELGIRAAFLNSSQDSATQHAVTQRLRSGDLDLLYVAPERLLQPRMLELLQTIRLALFAIDEAHCVSQWGHDFREEYMALDVLESAFPGVPRMALTATADRRTREEIVTRLALRNPAWFVAGFDRPNITYVVTPKATSPRSQLLRFLDERRGQAGIVYCMSRKKTEETAAWLSAQGFAALPYHAGLTADVRRRHQSEFLRADGVVMVATIAFGMGIDKPDVRFVCHLDLPKSMEAYYQETGRAGRDSEPATAWMVYGLQDVVRLRQMVEQSTSSDVRKRAERDKLDALLAWCESTTCRRQSLLAYFGDEYAHECGNCDVCFAPPRTLDATEAAQKLMSCVYRTGQRFGAMHMIDVLLGNDTEKVQQNRHNTLSTFGIGTELTANQWRAVVRQMLVQGYLRAEASRFGALMLTERSRDLLRGSVTFRLREDTAQQRTKRSAPAASPASRDTELTADEQQLWHALRELRRTLAAEHNVPPYVIFHDRTLKEMVRRRPRSTADLLSINGIGQAKLDRYGAAFLELLTA